MKKENTLYNYFWKCFKNFVSCFCLVLRLCKAHLFKFLTVYLLHENTYLKTYIAVGFWLIFLKAITVRILQVRCTTLSRCDEIPSTSLREHRDSVGVARPCCAQVVSADARGPCSHRHSVGIPRLASEARVGASTCRKQPRGRSSRDVHSRSDLPASGCCRSRIWRKRRAGRVADASDCVKRIKCVKRKTRKSDCADEKLMTPQLWFKAGFALASNAGSSCSSDASSSSRSCALASCCAFEVSVASGPRASCIQVRVESRKLFEVVWGLFHGIESSLSGNVARSSRACQCGRSQGARRSLAYPGPRQDEAVAVGGRAHGRDADVPARLHARRTAARVPRRAGWGRRNLTRGQSIVSTLSFLVADKLTQLLPANCERLVERNAVVALYRILMICNRSEPHVRIITFALNTLLNVALVNRASTRCRLLGLVFATPECLYLSEREHAEGGVHGRGVGGDSRGEGFQSSLQEEPDPGARLCAARSDGVERDCRWGECIVKMSSLQFCRCCSRSPLISGGAKHGQACRAAASGSAAGCQADERSCRESCALLATRPCCQVECRGRGVDEKQGAKARECRDAPGDRVRHADTAPHAQDQVVTSARTAHEEPWFWLSLCYRLVILR